MAMRAHDLYRIEVPSWAHPPDVVVAEPIDALALAAMRQAEAACKAAVHAEVVAYLTDPSLCFDDGTNFPSSDELTGAYYLGHRYYGRFNLDGEHVNRVSVQCRFLGLVAGRVDDYLGLEVHLSWSSSFSRFILWRNTDSSVI